MTTKKKEPKDQQVIRMAFNMMPTRTRAEAVDNLVALIPDADCVEGRICCWWIAEDDEYGTGDEMSMVFVHAGLQHAASAILTQLGITNFVEPRPARNRRSFAGDWARRREAAALKRVLKVLEQVDADDIETFADFEV